MANAMPSTCMSLETNQTHMQAHTTAVNKLLLSFHATQGSRIARSVHTATGEGAREDAIAVNTAFHVLQATAMQAVQVMDADSSFTAVHAAQFQGAEGASEWSRLAVSSAAKQVQAARDLLDEVQQTHQARAVAEATLPAVQAAEQQSLCKPLAVTVPAAPEADQGQAAAAAVEEKLAPIPKPPSARASAGAMLTWVEEAKASNGGNVGEVICAELEHWLYRLLQAGCVRTGTPQQQAKKELGDTAKLVTEYRAHLEGLERELEGELRGKLKRELESLISSQQDELAENRKRQLKSQLKGEVESQLKAELRSRGALAVWILLCLAHQAVAAEWPQLLEYALPVEPDELRLLVLRCPDAVAACLHVAEYVNAHCRQGAPVFSTKQGDATFELTERFVLESAPLLQHLATEEQVAREREAAFWQAVQAKKEHLAELDVRLASEKRDAASRREQEKADFASLDAALYRAVLHDARYNRRRSSWHGELSGTTEDCRSDRNQAVSISGSTDGRDGGQMRTSVGRTWQNARSDYVQSFNTVQALEKEIEDTEKPPPDLKHSAPSRSASHRSACAVAFFMRPEHTGCFPLLAQTCFEAEQVLLPTRTSQVAWSHDAVTSPKPSHQGVWYDYFNSGHAAVYVPRTDLQTSEPEATQARWVLLATSEQPGKASRPSSKNVRHYSKEQRHGIVYPAFNLQLLWQGGRLPSVALADTSASDPFAAAGVPRSKAAAVSFTKPGLLRSHGLLCVPTLAKSLLAGRDGKVQDMRSAEHARRGNRVYAETQLQPSRFTAQQWQALAALRAYPHTQMPQLCAILYDRVLEGVLHGEAVCPWLPSRLRAAGSR